MTSHTLHISFPHLCKALCFVVMLVVCAGCHKDISEELPEDKPREMRFAPNETPTRANLEETYESFLVYAFKTTPDNVVQTVMPGYLVEYDKDNEYYGSHWKYEDVNGQYLKYWDPSATKYVFSAIAPGEVTSGSATETKLASELLTIEVDNDGKMTLKDVSANVSTGDYDNSSKSPDWVVAKTIRTMGTSPADADGLDNSYNFPTLTSHFDKVPLNFHHIYAKVDIKVYAEKPITIMTFKMMIPENNEDTSKNTDEIPNKGNYNVASKTWSTDGVTQNDWLKRFADYTFVSTSGKAIPDDKDKAIILCSHLEMPQVFPDAGRKFDIIFTDVNGKSYSGYITLKATTNGTNSWLQNKHYTYTLKINNTEGSSEVILFAVDMETWKWQEGNSIEDEQHNW